MNVQLANPYDPAKNYKVAHWYATPKFDGVRAVFIPQRGFFTRNNKPINGLDDMAGILEDVCRVRGLSFVDGELVLAGGSFQASQSAILAADHAGKSSIEYHVFAVGGNFKNTQAMLKELPDCPKARIFRVESEVIHNTFEAVEAACRKFTAMGYEGVVLRHPDVPYREGRSNHLLKYKFFKEADLRIVGVIDGEGRLAGMLGSLVVEGEVEGKPVRSCVGTGLTDEDRKILGQDSQLIGKVLTVKYQSITEKPDKEGFYSLRFPVAVGVKEDRDFPKETGRVRKAKINFPEPTGVIYRSNGFVEAGFQIVFVDKPAGKLSCIPDRATMAGWKSRLYQCRSIDDGIRLIADLRLTIPQIMAFAEYLGVSLSGCRYLKAEIVRWVINASLGAKLRAKALMKVLRRKQEVQKCRTIQQYGEFEYLSQRMKLTACLQTAGYCSMRVRTTAGHSSFLGVNLISGIIASFAEMLRVIMMPDRSELIARLRNLQREVDDLMDMVIAMGDSQPQTVPSQEEAANGRWLTVRQVCEYLNISQTTFYEGIRSGVFPKGFAFGPKTIRWRIADIRAWQAKQAHKETVEPAKRRGRPSRVMKIGAFVNA